jgi:hypothetical protein
MTVLSLATATLSRETRAIILVLGALTATAAAKDVALISNKNNSVPTMALADVVKVCKGQLSRWPDGKPVTIIMRQPGSAELKIVEDKIYTLSSQDVRDVITSANHSRSDRPAIILGASDEEVIRKVESMPGAVGLVGGCLLHHRGRQSGQDRRKASLGVRVSPARKLKFGVSFPFGAVTEGLD